MTDSSLIPKKARMLAAGAAGGFALGSMFLVAGGSFLNVPKQPELPSPAVASLSPLTKVPTSPPVAKEPPAEKVVKAIPLTAMSKEELKARGISLALLERPKPIAKPSPISAPSAPSTILVSYHKKELPEPDLHKASLAYFLTRRAWMDELPAVYQGVLWGDTSLVTFMLTQGMDPNATTPSGDTPLCAAVRAGDSAMVDVLLLFGADPMRTGREGQAPLALASLKRSTPVLRLLLKAGADPNQPFVAPVDQSILEEVTIKDLRYFLANDKGITPLMACASRGDVEGAVELLRHGARTDKYTSKHKRYPLNFAATQQYLFLMRVLLGRSPDAEPNLLVTVDLSQQKAWITKDGKVIDSTKVSSGREGYSTPAGRYVVTDKHRSHTSTLYHVEMPWFMRLNCSAIGLHSGYVTGRPASHGCVRLPWDKAKAFFSVVQVGDEVEIVR